MDTKKQHIMKHALHIFIEKGIEYSSVQDILEKADISRGTFYKFFESKEYCLSEIISQTHSNIRNELQLKLIGKSIHDKEVLQEQLVLYLELVNKYHLYDLSHMIRQGHDMNFRIMTYQEEVRNIHWMADRIVEVYGDDIKSYSHEAMILYYSLLQTITVKYKIDNQLMDAKKIIIITMRYFELILQEMKQTKQSLFVYEESGDFRKKGKQVLIEELDKAYKNVPKDGEDDRDLIVSIKEEVKHDHPRKAVVLALTTALSDSLPLLKSMIEVYFT